MRLSMMGMSDHRNGRRAPATSWSKLCWHDWLPKPTPVPIRRFPRNWPRSHSHFWRPRPAATAPSPSYRDWRAYGGGPENIQYSALEQINRENVHRLEIAWEFDTGDAFTGSEMQCNPIVIDGVLFATTPRLRLVALDAATGELRWAFDPREASEPDRMRRNRGVTWWGDRREQRLVLCVRALSLRS